MTVKELREKLIGKPDDAEVLIFHADWVVVENIIVKPKEEKK